MGAGAKGRAQERATVGDLAAAPIRVGIMAGSIAQMFYVVKWQAENVEQRPTL